MLLLKYLPPPTDLTKEMQVEGINAYRRGKKTKMMGKDNPGMPPNRFPGTFQSQMDTLVSHPDCEEVCFPLLEAFNGCTCSRNFFSITSLRIVTANIY